jgi:hybrid cluster-associated redox disulfide protein
MAKKKSTDKKEFVNKDWSLGETLQQYPESMEVFAQFGMHCIGCAIAMHETIEQGAQVHGIDANELVKKINEAISKERGAK